MVINDTIADVVEAFHNSRKMFNQVFPRKGEFLHVTVASPEVGLSIVLNEAIIQLDFIKYASFSSLVFYPWGLLILFHESLTSPLCSNLKYVEVKFRDCSLRHFLKRNSISCTKFGTIK